MSPPFLSAVNNLSDRLFSATFAHSYKLAKGQAHVLYVPPLKELRSLVVCIPGNPGLLPLYGPFLTRLAEASPHLAILSHSYLGHTAGLPAPSAGALDLDAQVDANVEFLDSVLAWAGPDASITIAGHSVGSWVACKVAKLRPESVDALFLLTPTLSNIASTPNGRRLRWLFTPMAGWLLPILSSLLKPFTPIVIDRVLLANIRSDDAAFRRVLYHTLRDFVASPAVLTSVLTLARCEMRQILDLDEGFLKTNRSKICIMWAGKDNWVGLERERIDLALGVEPGADEGSVIEGEEGIPHSFCMEHNAHVADICKKWLVQRSLIERKALSGVRGGQEPFVVQTEEGSEEAADDIIM